MSRKMIIIEIAATFIAIVLCCGKRQNVRFKINLSVA